MYIYLRSEIFCSSAHLTILVCLIKCDEAQCSDLYTFMQVLLYRNLFVYSQELFVP
jgi:hypothetical protein